MAAAAAADASASDGLLASGCCCNCCWRAGTVGPAGPVFATKKPGGNGVAVIGEPSRFCGTTGEAFVGSGILTAGTTGEAFVGSGILAAGAIGEAFVGSGLTVAIGSLINRRRSSSKLRCCRRALTCLPVSAESFTRGCDERNGSGSIVAVELEAPIGVCSATAGGAGAVGASPCTAAAFARGVVDAIIASAAGWSYRKVCGCKLHMRFV